MLAWGDAGMAATDTEQLSVSFVGHRDRLILDASFLRHTCKDGRQINELAKSGSRLVLIDNLAFELCSTANRAQWPASQLKLSHYPDSVECWHHTSVMMRAESEQLSPYGDPLFLETTKAMRDVLRAGSAYTPDDLEAITKAEQDVREGDVMEAMFRAFEECARNAQKFSEQVAGRPLDDEETARACYGFVNNRENVTRLLGIGEPILALAGVDENWVTWHHYKAFLAVFCDYLRQGQPVFAKLPDKARKRWINIKHDLDYLISLALADGIASGETSGEQFHYRRWMYGDTKRFISVRSL
jgi:hypothetical protein